MTGFGHKISALIFGRDQSVFNIRDTCVQNFTMNFGGNYFQKNYSFHVLRDLDVGNLGTTLTQNGGKIGSRRFRDLESRKWIPKRYDQLIMVVY